MQDINIVTISGYVKEILEKKENAKIPKISLVVKSTKKMKNNIAVYFFQVEIFGKVAHAVWNKIKKEDKILIFGELRGKGKIVASKVLFLDNEEQKE